MVKSRYTPTAYAGVHGVGLKVTEDLGWIFREQVVADTGIDAHVEVCDGPTPTGRLLALQIKSGESYFKEASMDGFVYRGSIDHLEYWTRHALPVLVVLYDQKTSTCFWEHVNANTVQRTQKHWKLLVPRSQILNTDAKVLLADIADGPVAHQNLRKLALAKPMMLEVKAGARYFLEAEEWVNKTSGRGAVRIVRENDQGEENAAVDWHSFHAGMMAYESLFRDMLPWADFIPDYELYSDAADSEYLDDHGIWDSEDNQYFIPDEEERQDYIRNACAPGIRPYATEASEVAAYRLQLTLNDVGRAYLVLDDFLSAAPPIVATLPWN